MSNLNIIEQKIRDKAVAELMEIIERFENDLGKLTDTYGHKSFYSFNEDKSTTCMQTHEYRNQLMFSLKNMYLENMVKKKSSELLEKLEMI
jgi:hypothetical protein